MKKLKIFPIKTIINTEQIRFLKILKFNKNELNNIKIKLINKNNNFNI